MYRLVCLALLALLLQPREAAAQRRGDGFVTTDPATVEKFQEAFNQDKGLPRLVVLLSPT